MKKRMFKVLCVVLVMALLSPNVFASISTSQVPLDDAAIDPNQREIDALFTELNELAMEEYLLSSSNEDELSTASTQTTARMNAINARESELNARLEQLGVHEIDPNNAEDMAQLQEVMMGSMMVNGTESVPNPPDLSDYALLYTLQQYNGTTQVNGVTYNYSYIYVTDNKRYANSPLTIDSGACAMVGRRSMTITDILDMSFSFAAEELVGTLPWGLRWTVSSLFEILETKPGSASVTYYNNQDIYSLNIHAKTQMMYCYVYMPVMGWTLCGTKAPNITFTRSDYLDAIIDGEYETDSSVTTSTVSTGVSAVTYARNYVQGSGHVVHQYGWFSVEGEYGIVVTISPGFATYPAQLIL